MVYAPARLTDKRIQCDEEFSDSEDEGEGGRKDRRANGGPKSISAPDGILMCT